MGALALGSLPLAVVYGVAAGLAALQIAATRPITAPLPVRGMAAAVSAGAVLAAALSAQVAGVVVLAGALLTVALAGVPSPGWLGRVGLVVPVWLLPGLAGAGVVLSYTVDRGAALTLILLVSAYESGDYLIGTGAAHRFEGPVVGIVAVLVMTFAVSVVALPPFELRHAFVFGAMAALLCVIGQWVASLVLPRADAFAPALRRLDSLILLAPFWAVAVDAYVRVRAG